MAKIGLEVVRGKSAESTGMAFHRRAYRVARQLKYRPLPGLLGQRVLIQDLDSITESVSRKFDLGPAADSESRFEGMMAKYQLLDLEFHSTETLTPADRGGVSLLKELGFIRTDRDADEEDWCLEALEDSLDKGETLIKLFLRAEFPVELPMELRRTRQIPPGYLPRNYLVEDACLTNAGYVWIHKHFYL